MFRYLQLNVPLKVASTRTFAQHVAVLAAVKPAPAKIVPILPKLPSACIHAQIDSLWPAALGFAKFPALIASGEQPQSA
jgi:hypothetical protein